MGKLFKIAEALKILELGEEGRDRVFYWIMHKNLIVPEIQGEGRGGRTKLSIKNIVELGLIKELAGFGFELNAVKKVLEMKHDIHFDKDGKRLEKSLERQSFVDYICHEYRRSREGQEFDIFLTIHKDKNNKFVFGSLHNWSNSKFGTVFEKDINSVFVVDLYGILERIEKLSAEKI